MIRILNMLKVEQESRSGYCDDIPPSHAGCLGKPLDIIHEHALKGVVRNIGVVAPPYASLWLYSEGSWTRRLRRLPMSSSNR